MPGPTNIGPMDTGPGKYWGRAGRPRAKGHWESMTPKDHDRILDRRELAKALLGALERRHEILDIIVESTTRADAVAAIAGALATSESNAEAVLRLPLGSLTKTERDRISNEISNLDASLDWTPVERPKSVDPSVRLRPIDSSSGDDDLFRARCAERLEDDGTPWSPERIASERSAGSRRVADESAVWLVAVDTAGEEPQRVGFVFGEWTGQEVDVAVWVAPEQRKKGYGTALLKQSRSELAAYFPGTTLVVRAPA